jgi:hypothetical protein
MKVCTHWKLIWHYLEYDRFYRTWAGSTWNKAGSTGPDQVLPGAGLQATGIEELQQSCNICLINLGKI